MFKMKSVVRTANICTIASSIRVERSRNHVTCRENSGFGGRAVAKRLHTATRRSNNASVVRAMDDGGVNVGDSLWSHVMVALVDSNPSLSTASRTALQQGARLAMGNGKLTVLILNDEGKEDADRMTNLKRELEAIGLADVQVVEESVEHSTGKGSVAIGDAADSFEADLVVMSTNVVHEKHVDANLLAEFVPAPVLLLP